MSDEQYDKIWTEMGLGGPTSDGYHSLSSYLACPKKYQYGKVRGIKKPISSVPDYFAVGQLMHVGRAVFLAGGSKLDTELIDSAYKAIEKAAAESPLPIREEAVGQAQQYMTEYIDHWGMRPAPRTIATEKFLGCDIGSYFTARIDDLSFYSEEGNRLCIGECKTTSLSPAAVLTQYRLHPQVVLQQILYRQSPEGEAIYGSIAGTVLDVIQKGYSGAKCHFARFLLPVNVKNEVRMQLFLVNAKREASSIQWDTPADRNFHSCTEMAGNMRVPCEFQPLCLEGRDAATQFVTASGEYLHQHESRYEAAAMPWE